MKFFLLLLTAFFSISSAGLGFGRKKLEGKNQLINYHLHHENGVKVQTSCDGTFLPLFSPYSSIFQTFLCISSHLNHVFIMQT